MTTGFSKKEKIISKNSMEHLYTTGSRIYSKSFSLIWNKGDHDPKIKLLIVVPKKNIKQAVNRNYIKRIIRESYLINKSMIYDMILNPIKVILIYKKSSLPKFDELRVELLTLFKHLEKK